MNRIFVLFITIITLLVAPTIYAQPGSGCHVIDGAVFCPPQKQQNCTVLNGQKLCPSAMSPAELEQREKAAQEASATQFRAWCTASGWNLDVSGTHCIIRQQQQQVWMSYQMWIHTSGRGFSSDVYVSSPYGWYGGPRYGSYLGW